MFGITDVVLTNLRLDVDRLLASEKGFCSVYEATSALYTHFCLEDIIPVSAAMPMFFLERFPWPSLQSYTALSAVLLAGTVLSTYSIVTEPEYDTSLSEEAQVDLKDKMREEQKDDFWSVASKVLLYLVSDSLFVWVILLLAICLTKLSCDCLDICEVQVVINAFQVMVNTACCMLMLIAKAIQSVVFGPLRASEKQVTIAIVTGLFVITAF